MRAWEIQSWKTGMVMSPAKHAGCGGVWCHQHHARYSESLNKCGIPVGEMPVPSVCPARPVF